MSCFTKKMVNHPKFPVFTRRMHELKEEEGGVTAMCDVMKKYEQIAAEKARMEGHAEGCLEERMATIQKMLKRGDTLSAIADFYEIDIAEVEAVERGLCAPGNRQYVMTSDL